MSLAIHEARVDDLIETGKVVRRGDIMTVVVNDRTRVTHPKTADIIEIDGKYLVVPVHHDNPIVRRDTFDECMSFIMQYVRSE